MASTRRRNPNLLGPPAICDNCRRQCCTLDQAGIVCYHCQAGTFIHRGFWRYLTCPACHGHAAFCEVCHRSGVLAEPLDDFALDMPALQNFWRVAIERRQRDRQDVPAFMLAGAYAAGLECPAVGST